MYLCKKKEIKLGRNKKTKEDFITEALEIHGNKYSYNDLVYHGANVKANFFCNKHGHFQQTPNVHLRGHGCPECGKEIQNRNLLNNTEYFIEKAKHVHGDYYIYDKVKYLSSKKDVIIICPKHGEFKQVARYHLDGNGCKECQYDNIRLTNELFIKKATEIHNNKYDYSLVNYINNSTLIHIICPIHGEFSQTPQNHLNDHGCSSCNISKGEKKIKKILELNNIDFEMQKKFNNCINKKELPFDFYLPNYNTLIEYDGKQHFESIEYFGGENMLKYIKENDNIKSNFAKKYGYELIRIPYYEYNNIENLLINIL